MTNGSFGFLIFASIGLTSSSEVPDNSSGVASLYRQLTGRTFVGGFFEMFGTDRGYQAKGYRNI